MNSRRGVAGWSLRLALAFVAATAWAVAALGAPQIGVWSVAGVIMMALVLVTAFAPDSAAPLLLLIGLVLYRLATPGPTVDPGLAILVLLLPLIHQLAGIAAAVPARALCRWQALRPAGLRLAVAVLPVELVLLVVAL